MEQLKKKDLAKELGYNEKTKKTISTLREELARNLQCGIDSIEEVLANSNSQENIAEDAVEEHKASEEDKEEMDLESFEAPCGSTFDFNPESACHIICKTEQPEVFNKCKAKFDMKTKQKSEKKKPATKKAKGSSKSSKKYDAIGDGVGTSASMINSLLICGASLDEMESEVDVPKTRIQGHFGGLKAGNTRRSPKEIFKDKETGRYFIDDPELPYYGDMNEEGVTPVEVSKPKGQKVSAKKKEEKKTTKKAKVVKKAKEKTTN